ncbi:MAG: exodeoxyribonuclease VII large subunit, partial [Flavobacteriales bacterium]|nr:exodeoxyribonuclease VII large subunit [Flavobacteriales bacterium]
MGDKHHSLLQVLQSVQKMFEHHWKRAIWVKVEIAKINHYPHSGHAYPLLVEKKNGTTVAEIRSTVWASTYQRIKRKFETMTKKELVDGLEVLLLVDVKFTASHGLALNIIDIDASYTLGAMELEKIATLKRLKDENLFHTNKNLQLPILLKRVAVISVETSKGYHDFVETLANNKRKFRVEYELFPALLQGDKAIESIRRQLDEIRSRKDQFDVVAIIRGGGGEVGLNCYDNFVLSSAVARFPLPIISGIGHATNLTVVEMVSYINLITPTALANYVLSGFEEFESRMILAENKLIFHSEKIIKDSLSDLQKLIFVFDSDVRLLLQEEKFRIDAVKNSLEFGGREILSKGSKGI